MNKTPGTGKDQHLAAPLEVATLSWNDQEAPVSTTFDDVYYSKANGLEETRYVFLGHNQVESRWQELEDSPATQFTIVETGFGTGLNFLATCIAWNKSGLNQARLHFVSIEKYPLTPTDLRKALGQWPELADISEQLLHHYPPLVPGFHRIAFPQLRVELTLVFADVITAIDQMMLQADAWYLDGFAPGKNPDMWQDALFQGMARLSKPQASFATFTAAGIVKRGLQAAGFNVKKVPGFGHKRDMLAGVLETPVNRPEKLPMEQAPWFISRPAQPAPKTALVIGAGLAGSNTAYALAQRGVQVTVLEKNDAIAAEASGNPVGITFTKLSPFDTPQNRFYQKAYLYAVQAIAQRLQGSSLQEGKDYALNGVLRFAFDAKEKAEQEKLQQSGLWPESFATAMSQADCAALLGFPSQLEGFFLKKGGWLTPAEFCQVSLAHPLIDVVTGAKAESMSWEGDHWAVETGSATFRASALIVASSFGAAQLAPLSHLPLRSVRGQITYVPATAESEQHLQHALNYDGYITPAKKGFHCVGATFQPKSCDTDFYAHDHAKNLNAFKEAVPWLYEKLIAENNPDVVVEQWPLQQGRVAFRCQSPDYLPIIGPVPDLDAFLTDYADLRRGVVKKPYPTGNFLPACYVNLAHGSRGITSSLMGAEIIAADLCAEPQLIDRDVLQAIHPARFIIRDLRRNRM